MKPKNRLTKKQNKDLTQARNGQNFLVNFKLSEERDQKVQQQRDLENARIIWESWKHRFINRRKPMDDLPKAVNELCGELEKKIKGQDLLKYLIQQLEPIIAKLHGLSILEKMMVEVYADCPHSIAGSAGMKICGWGGVVGILKRAWADKEFHLICPQCENQLGPDDCALRSNIDKQIPEK